MANSDDDILVRAKFDGRNFNSGIDKSTSALEKFKKTTSFEDQQNKAAKFSATFTDGINDMQKSVNGFNVNNIDISIGSLNDKLSSGLDGIAGTITNKLNSIIYTIQSKFKMVWEGINVEPKMSGFKEYETQINAVQTILANTSHAGTTIEEVMNALDELNSYADLTIYNFTEMTRNIGTFTAAGVDLNTSTAAIKGIANLGAISGSTSEQVSRAMYQLSQALASGRVSLMDWNSVVNAGMGGKVFQDALVSTAERMGKVVDLSNGFRESISLSNGESWLTSDVLLETLKEFSDADTELGKLGVESATKVKTITQLWDTVKETVQSSWTTTWTTIVGDFEDARGTLTSVSNKINELLSLKANRRNSILEYWATARKEGVETAETVSEVDEEIERLAYEVIRGDWSNGQERFNMLDQAGYDHVAIQKRVDEILGIITPATEEINTVLGEGTQTGREMFIEGLSNIGNFLTRLYKTFFTVFNEVFMDARTAGENLVKISEKFRDFSKIFVFSEDQWVEVESIVKGVINVLKIVQTAIGHIVTAFKTAFSVMDFSSFKKSIYELLNIDPEKTGGSLLGFFAEIGKRVSEFSEAFENSNVTDFFIELGKYIGSVGQTVIDFLTDIIDFFNLPADVRMEALGDAFEHAEERINNLIDTLNEVLKPALEVIRDTFDSVVNDLGIDTDKIGKSVNKLSKNTKKTIKNIKSLLTGEENQNGISERVDDKNKELDVNNETNKLDEDVKQKTDIDKVKKNATEKIKEIVSDIASVLNTIISLLIAGEGLRLIIAVRTFISSLSDIADTMTGGVGAISKSLKGLSSVLHSLSFEISATAILTIAVAIAILAVSLKSLSKIDPQKLSDATDSITLLFIGLVGALSVTGSAGKYIKASYVSRLSTNIATSILLLTAALKVISSLNEKDIAKSLTVMGVLVGYIKIIISSISNLVNATDDVDSFKGLGGILTSLALSINLLIVPLLILSVIPQKTLTKGISALGSLIGILMLFVNVTAAVVGLTNRGTNDITGALGKLGIMIVSLALAVNLLIVPLTMLSIITAISPLSLVGGIVGLASLFAVIAGGIFLISKSIKQISSSTNAMKKMTKLLLVFSTTMIVFSLSVTSLLPTIIVLSSLATLSPVALIASIGALALLILTISSSMILIIKALAKAKTKKMKTEVLAMITTSILALVGGVVSILFAIQPLLSYNVSNIATVFGGVGLLILTLTTVIAVLGKIKKIDTMVFATLFTLFAGLDTMLYLMKDLDKKQIDGAIKIALISSALMAAALILIEVLGKHEINVGDTVNNNYNQINKVVQFMLGLGAVFTGIGVFLLGFTKIIDKVVELSAFDAPDISKGFITIGKALMESIPIFAAVIIEFIVAILGVISSLNHVSIAAQLFSKFVLVVEAIMALMATGDLIPRFVQFVLQVVATILFLLAGAIDEISEAVTIIIIGIFAGIGRALESHSDDLAQGMIQIITGLANVAYQLIVSIFGEKLSLAVVGAILMSVAAGLIGATLGQAILLGTLGGIIYYVVSELWKIIIKNMSEEAALALGIMVSIGVLIVSGLALGISAAPLILIGVIAFLVSLLIVKFCELLGIASPSKVFMEFGYYLILGLANGIVNTVKEIGKALKKVWDEFTTWLHDETIFGEVWDYGKNLIEGLINGIKEKASAIWDTIKEACGSAFRKFCDFFGIASPSKLMEQMGEYIDQGLANGITGDGNMITDAMGEIQNGIVGSLDTGIGKSIGQNYSESIADGMIDGQGYIKDASVEMGNSIDYSNFDLSAMDFTMPTSDIGEMPDILGEGTAIYDFTFGGTTGSKDIINQVSDISKDMNDSFGDNTYDFGGILSNIQNSMDTGSMFNNFGEQAGIDMSTGFENGFDSNSIVNSINFGDMLSKNSYDDGLNAGESASVGFGYGISSITSSPVMSIFNKTGEESGNSFLNGLTGSGGDNGLVSSLTGVFGNSGEESGNSFLGGLSNSLSNNESKDSISSKLQGLFNSTNNEISTTADVTPVLAMGSEDALSDDIMSKIKAGTVDVSSDARVGIEESGISEQIDRVINITNSNSRTIMNKIDNLYTKLSNVDRQLNMINSTSTNILDNLGHDIYLDSDTLVGTIGPTLDGYLGRSASLRARREGVAVGPPRSWI